jgi:hypothetical protein
MIRASEIQRVLAISGGGFDLEREPQPRPVKGVTNTCEVWECSLLDTLLLAILSERSLLDTFRFCFLGCKVRMR